MTGISAAFVLATCGLVHIVTCQTGIGQPGLEASNLPAGPNVKADVTATVMALINETGYSGKASDANVQEIVAMLMNGTVPTDADLIRLGILPQRTPSQMTTSPPYTILGNPAGVDLNMNLPSMNLPSGSATGPSSGSLSGASPGGFFVGSPIGIPTASPPYTILGNPAGVDLNMNLPSMNLPSGSATGPSSGSLSGASPGGFFAGPPIGIPTGLGAGGTNPFAFGGPIGTAGFPNNPLIAESLGTTPKPLLGDPFSQNSVAVSGLPLPNLGPNNPNALGPKPFSSLDPVGGLGTPGSTTDLLGSLGMAGAGGLGNVQQPIQTGILETARNQQNQGNIMNNPMMMMFMMMPELIDQMMAENPMMLFFMMQQFARPGPTPKPSPPRMSSSLPMDMGALAGTGGPAGAGAGSMMTLPLPGSSSMGGNTGGLMDIMNSMGTTGAGSMAAPGLAGGAPGVPTLDAAGMGSFMNMVSTGTAGFGPSAAPIANPFLAFAG